MFNKITSEKRSKFGCYLRFPSFCYLEDKPLDFICDSHINKGIKIFLFSSDFFTSWWNVDAFKRMWYFCMIYYTETIAQRCSWKSCTEKFCKIYRKILVSVSFLIKLPEGCSFIKKETLTQALCCLWGEIFKNTFFIEALGGCFLL